MLNDNNVNVKVKLKRKCSIIRFCEPFHKLIPPEVKYLPIDYILVVYDHEEVMLLPLSLLLACKALQIGKSKDS